MCKNEKTSEIIGYFFVRQKTPPIYKKNNKLEKNLL